MTEFNNTFSQENWESTYKFANEQTIDDTFRRIAKAVAAVENNPEHWENRFFHLLQDFKFVPGGRIISNAGTGITGTSLINCFVDGFAEKDPDSMESIMDSLKRQALILKSEGGYGNNFDVLRPKGAYINGIANETPGVIEMMGMWDKQSEVITKGSGKISDKIESKKKIRKGAQMAVMSCWHPEVEGFITAKLMPNTLTKFNMSVAITDDFMNAVKNHLPWNLIFPDFDNCKDDYKTKWNGDIEKWRSLDLPIKTYYTYTDANILWDKIVHSTYERNEPGILFIDRINQNNNLFYCEHIFATNPCGEQPLSNGGVCLLSNINLTKYIKDKDWDKESLLKDIPIMIRFMDNINEIANVPLEHQRLNLLNKRRIGLGVMGYASALLMLQLKYGSNIALQKTEELLNLIANKAYQSSVELSIEKGSFPLYRPEYNNSEYLKILSEETRSQIRKYGIRNSHLLSIAPTGNTAVLANNVSGGLEPLFSTSYYRTYIVAECPKGLTLPLKINWLDCTGDINDWSWIREGDENLLSINFNGEVYKFDKNRGLTKVVLVEDYGYSQLIDKNAPYIVTADKLSIDDHINTMSIFAKYVDAGVSKTINIPNDYSYEDFKDVYNRIYSSGVIKGCTTYREGTMMNVLSTTIQTPTLKNNALKRPKRLPCDINTLTVNGNKWTVLIGLLESEKPYEVFAFKSNGINFANSTKGFLTKIKSGHYDLELEKINIENITKLFEQDEEEALTRMISMSLRHNVDLKYIIEQLNKSQGTIISFSKAISRTLKKYVKEESTKGVCPICGKELLLIEGCVKCSNCDYSIC